MMDLTDNTDHTGFFCSKNEYQMNKAQIELPATTIFALVQAIGVIKEHEKEYLKTHVCEQCFRQVLQLRELCQKLLYEFDASSLLMKPRKVKN